MFPIWSSNSLFFEHPDIFGVSFDSRSVKKGDLFIALRGKNFDGHDFVEEALLNGASCALVERKICDNNIIVNSCLDTFVEIAKFRRSLFGGKVVAITGSVGKSTLRYSLVSSLESSFKVQSPIKNYNTLIGLSFFYSQFDLSCDFLIVEIGIEQKGEMDLVADLVSPDYSLLINVSSSHSYSLGPPFSILNEKALIFKHTNFHAFFIDDIWYSPFLKGLMLDYKLPFSTFSFAKDSRDLMKNAAQSLFNVLGIRSSFSISEIAGRRDIFSFSKSGYNVSLVDSSYNANIASMIDELNFFKAFIGDNKIAILGDMFGYNDRYHEFLIVYCPDIFQYWLIGMNMYYLHLLLPNSLFFYSVDDLMAYLCSFINALRFDCSFLVKGSNFMQLNKVVDCFKSFVD